MTTPGALRRAGAVCRRLTSVAVFAALMLGAAPSMAPIQAQTQTQTDAPVTGILVLNQERLLTDSLYGQRIQSEVEEVSSRLAAENRAIEAELTADELELTELRPTLDADAFRALADEFDERVEGIRAAQEAKARDLATQAERARQQFYDRATPILLEIVRDRGAAVLMDSRSVLLSAERVDITEDAVAALDDRLAEGGADPIISIDLQPAEDATEVETGDETEDGAEDGAEPAAP